MPSKLMQYDQYERHQAVSLLLAQTDGCRVLDAGGIKGLLSAHLPGATVSALNVDSTGDTQYGGQVIPFAAQAFHIVVSLDTIEHMPGEQRLDFLAECIRVSRQTVLIASPLGTPAHAAYEATLDSLHNQVYGHYHQMLHEHVLYGLPTAEDLASWGRFFDEHGFSSRVRYAGDFVWQCRNMERSLRLVQRLGWLGRMAAFLNLATSMAVWHPIVLSDEATETSNRYYFLAERR